jgi:hypothetical protein
LERLDIKSGSFIIKFYKQNKKWQKRENLYAVKRVEIFSAAGLWRNRAGACLCSRAGRNPLDLSDFNAAGKIFNALNMVFAEFLRYAF